MQCSTEHRKFGEEAGECEDILPAPHVDQVCLAERQAWTQIS